MSTFKCGVAIVSVAVSIDPVVGSDDRECTKTAKMTLNVPSSTKQRSWPVLGGGAKSSPLPPQHQLFPKDEIDETEVLWKYLFVMNHMPYLITCGEYVREGR